MDKPIGIYMPQVGSPSLYLIPHISGRVVHGALWCNVNWMDVCFTGNDQNRIQTSTNMAETNIV